MHPRRFDLIVFDWEGTLAVPSMTKNGEPILFSGVHEMLRDLQSAGYVLAVATGMSRQGLDFALKSTALKLFFEHTRCAEETYSKPHPAMLQELAEAAQISLARTLMIGDTTYDLQMAEHAGADSVAVAYGLHSLCSLRSGKALFCADNVAQLHRWLLRYG